MTIRGKSACRNCNEVRPIKARGLCHRCHSVPGVRERYSVRWAFLPIKSFNWAGALAKESTMALPGSEEKVRVMELRAAEGRSVFHPADGPTDDGR